MNLTLKALAVVTVTVLLQLLGAALLKQASLSVRLGLLVPALFILCAFGVQGLRFLLWGYAHKRWPLSVTYPLTAVFFPMLIALAAFYGEPVTLQQWLGGLCITAGVAWLALQRGEA
jgi:drug/metabolite transporter (DMT)-like permease